LWRSSGEKVKQQFSFRPITEQLPNGRLYNERMYREHTRHQVLKVQKQEAVRSRWGSRNGETIGGRNGDGRITEDHTESIRGASQLPTFNPNIGGEGAAATYQCAEEQPAAGPPPLDESNTTPARAVTEADYELLARHAADLGIQVPDKPTAIRILQRFPDIPPDKLPRFPGQKSSGLWLQKNLFDVTIEIRRQEVDLIRKPPERDGLMEWALECERREK